MVFDWDGTLMDSGGTHCDLHAAGRGAGGMPVPDNAAARDVIGLGLIEAVQRLFPDADAPAVTALVDAYRMHWLGDGSSGTDVRRRR